MSKVTQLEDDPGVSNFVLQHFITKRTVFRDFFENLRLEILKVKLFENYKISLCVWGTRL